MPNNHDEFFTEKPGPWTYDDPRTFQVPPPARARMPRCWMLEFFLPETSSSHLKMDGWKMTIPFGIVYFQVLLLLVSERVTDQEVGEWN